MSDQQLRFWHEAYARRIVGRAVVEGDLELLSPAHFGNGDGSDETDLPLLTDSLDLKCLVLTSAAGRRAARLFAPLSGQRQ